MGCCGLLRRRRGKGSRASTPEHGTPPEASLSPALGERRPSLLSLQSGNTIYYDAEEGPGENGDHSHVHSPRGLSDAESESPRRGGFPEGPQEEERGILAGLMDVFVRRGSVKSGKGSGSDREPSGEMGKAASLGPSASREHGGGAQGSLESAPSYKPFAGSSFKRGEQVGSTDGIECWQVADATSFQVRGPDYDTSRVKVPSRGAVYRLVGVDAYSFERKLYHIAQHVQLPPEPARGPDHAAAPPGEQLPPFLVLNIQLPLYKPGLMKSATDGKGVSLVYYFALPDGFELAHVENAAALRLLQRFVHGGTEANGEATRERLKLIARVVNVEQWAVEGPLSSYEHGLLRRYNDKPILTRPQHAFFTGPNYLEVDLDIHTYAWVARQAFGSFIPRLGPVVFENAFVVQGNTPEELPEVVLACARVSRIDLFKVQPFPATLVQTRSKRVKVELDPDAPPLVASSFPDDGGALQREARDDERVLQEAASAEPR